MNLSHSRSTGNVRALQRAFSQGGGGAGRGVGARPLGGGAPPPLRKSASASNCVIVSKRGFKPSDRHDPQKREFLTSLTAKLWHLSLPGSGRSWVRLPWVVQTCSRAIGVRLDGRTRSSVDEFLSRPLSSCVFVSLINSRRILER